MTDRLRRRHVLVLGVKTALLTFVPAVTKAKRDDCLQMAVTPRQVEGPFFKPGAPRRFNLTTNPRSMDSIIKISGKVINRNCQPIDDAILNFWHASPDGLYDSETFKYRASQKCREDGSYQIFTDFPGEYVGRTPHIHVKVKAQGKELTTQVYFPNQKSNRNDYFFDRRLLLRGLNGTYYYDFVMA